MKEKNTVSDKKKQIEYYGKDPDKMGFSELDLVERNKGCDLNYIFEREIQEGRRLPDNFKKHRGPYINTPPQYCSPKCTCNENYSPFGKDFETRRFGEID